MKWLKYILISVLFLFAFGKTTLAQEATVNEGPTRILFVLDASNSMKKLWFSKQKWSSAKKVLVEMVDSLDKIPNVEIGLRVYGHQTILTENDCEDSRLEVTIGDNKADYLRSRIAKLDPKGITPIAYSLEKCANDFPTEPGRNIVILITDGEESCAADPCKMSKALQEKNIILKPVVIGMDIPEYDINPFKCIGPVYNSQTEQEFKDHLQVVINRALSTTSIQVDLLDVFGKPTETNANMTFYDAENGLMKYNFYHTIDNRGNPDSIFVDPLSMYNIIVHTIPPVRIDSIELTPNTHNIIKIPAPQGYIQLEMQSSATIKNSIIEEVQCLVTKAEGYGTEHVQAFNTTEKYIVGNYDLDILTTPRIKLEDVTVKQSENTVIKIPAPGIVTLNKPNRIIGGIFEMVDNRMVKIYHLKPSSMQEVIALQPGTYRIVYRSEKSKSMHTSIDKEIKVKSGETTTVKL